MKNAMLGLLCALATASVSQGATVLIDGGGQYLSTTDQSAIVDYYTNNFVGTTVTIGNYSNTDDAGVKAAIAAADVLVLSRRTNSGDYSTSDGAYYSTLNIPVVFHTSYVTRSTRIAFEGGTQAGGNVADAETTVTAAGSAVFGVAEGTYDWLTTGIDSLGTGSVGTGKVLASIGGNNLSVVWNAGDTDASGRTQTAKRLLWNLNAYDKDAIGSAHFVTLPDTTEGMAAMTKAIETYTGLVAVPEPATMGLLGLGGLLLRKRRSVK